MIIVPNRYIPFEGFKAMCLWPFIFIRDSFKIDWNDINHENIHGIQQLEMGVVGMIIAIVLWMLDCGYWSLLTIPVFFWWYLIEWGIRHFMKGNAYRNISFEKEAYTNEKEVSYISKRSPFAWIKYL